MKWQNVLAAATGGFVGGFIMFAVWPAVWWIGVCTGATCTYFLYDFSTVRSAVGRAANSAGQATFFALKYAVYTLTHMDGSAYIVIGLLLVGEPFFLSIMIFGSSASPLTPSVEANVVGIISAFVLITFSVILMVLIQIISDIAAARQNAAFWNRVEKSNIQLGYCNATTAEWVLQQTRKLPERIPNTTWNRARYTCLGLRGYIQYLMFGLWRDLIGCIIYFIRGGIDTFVMIIQGLRVGIPWLLRFTFYLTIYIASQERVMAALGTALGCIITYTFTTNLAPTLTAHLLASVLAGLWSGTIAYFLHRFLTRSLQFDYFSTLDVRM